MPLLHRLTKAFDQVDRTKLLEMLIYIGVKWRERRAVINSMIKLLPCHYVTIYNSALSLQNFPEIWKKTTAIKNPPKNGWTQKSLRIVDRLVSSAVWEGIREDPVEQTN